MAVRKTNLEETTIDPEIAGDLRINREWVIMLNKEIHYGWDIQR